MVQIGFILIGLPNTLDSVTIALLSYTLAVDAFSTALAFKWARLLFEIANEAKAAAICKTEFNIARGAYGVPSTRVINFRVLATQRAIY